MNNILSTVLAFSVGAAAGALVTWKLLDKKYRQIAREEIDSVKKVYTFRYPKEEQDTNEPESDKKEPVINKAEKTINDSIKHEYINIANKYSGEQEGGSEQMSFDDKPWRYVIPPNEFDVYDDYETISLTCYADGYVTDDMDELIDNVDDIIGIESLDHFGEYEPDTVFVRNDKLKIDYEILLVNDCYYDTYCDDHRRANE